MKSAARSVYSRDCLGVFLGRVVRGQEDRGEASENVSRPSFDPEANGILAGGIREQAPS